MTDPLEATIRPAGPADAGEIAGLLRELDWFAHIAQEPPAATTARVARHLAACLADDSHAVWVAQDAAGQVLGYVVVHWLPYLLLVGPEGYVSDLFVRTAARGQGLGGRLLAAVKEAAVARGCRRLQLLNRRTRPSYARGFYPKQGWQEREDMAVFVLPLET